MIQVYIYIYIYTYKQFLTPADTLLSQETNLCNLLSISRTFISLYQGSQCKVQKAQNGSSNLSLVITGFVAFSLRR